jgi:O-antigen/teichoic acid export membrane protein
MKSRETLIISGGLLAQQVTVFATGVLIARFLGAAGFGTLGILKSLSGVLVIVMPLGLDLALLKHASFYQEQPGELATTSRALRLLVAGCNLLLLIALMAGLGAVLQRLYRDIPDFAALCAITMAGLVFAADIQISGALYRVFNRVVLYFGIVNYTQPVLRILLSAAVLVSGGGVESITIVNALVFLVSFLMIAWADRGRGIQATPMPAAILMAKLRLILSESLWMAISLLVYQLIRLVDILILAALTTPQITGAYTAISSVAQLIQIYPNAVSQTLGPEIALAYKNRDTAGINAALQAYLRKASIMGGYLLGGVAVFGTDLSLIFGHGFNFPWLLPVLLGAGWFISATLAPLGYVLSMTGRHRLEVVILTGGAVLLVVCLLLLIPVLQATGAALSVAITFGVVNVLRSATVIRIIGRNPISWRHGLPPILFITAAFVCRQAGLTMHGQTLLTLIVQCVAYTAVAAGLYLGLLASRDEVAAMLRRIGRRGLRT